MPCASSARISGTIRPREAAELGAYATDAPQHFFHVRPLRHGQGSLRPTLALPVTVSTAAVAIRLVLTTQQTS